MSYNNHIMSTITEIESAIEALPLEQKQELLLFVAARLRAQSTRVPEPRKFSPPQVRTWIDEDEADMRRFREGK